MKIKCIIFDFDGVIKDSVDIKTKAFAEIFSKYGTSIVDKVLEHHNLNGGVSRFEKIKHYYKQYLKINLTKPQIEEIANTFSEIVLNKVVEAPFISGAKSFIKDNHNRYNMFISTGTPTNEIHQIIETNKINHYFIGVFGSPESKIDHLDLIINKWKLKKEEMIFIGDSITDKNASQHFGIEFIAVSNNIDGELINEKNQIINLLELKRMINSIEENSAAN